MTLISIGTCSGADVRKLEILVGNNFAYLCRQFHNLETHRQRDTAFIGENPTPSA